MSTKNSQILLIENALQSLNKHIYEKENSIRMLENQAENYKETISNLKYEFKTAINEQEKLDAQIEKLEKTNATLENNLKEKEQQLAIKIKELDTIGIQNEEFLQSVEQRMKEARKQMEDKNSIILEVQRINKELNAEIHHLKEEYDNSGYDNSMLKKELKNQRKTISKLEKKLQQQAFKSFIDSNDKFDYPNESILDNEEFDLSLPKTIKKDTKLHLDKLEGKLLEAKKGQAHNNQKLPDISSEITEEDIIRKKLGF